MTCSMVAALLIVAQASCNHADNRDSFVRTRTAEARLREATTIALVHVVDSSPLFFDAGGQQDVCGYHARVELIEIVGGASVASDFISGKHLIEGAEYLAALLDLTGRLPPVADDPQLDESDWNYERCRDQYTVYSLGEARVVVSDGEEKVEVISAKLIPEEIRGRASGGQLDLAELLDAVVRLRAQHERE